MEQTLTVVSPWIPAYRRGLYDRLTESLRREGIEFGVLDCTPPPSLRAREDRVEAPWARCCSVKWISLGQREIARGRTAGMGMGRNNLVIVEQAIKNLDTYPVLAKKYLGGASVAMWGHGATYSAHQGALVGRAKMWLTRRTDWFFAYTAKGAAYVNERGFPANRTTVLWNTLDSKELSTNLQGITGDALETFMTAHGLTRGRTALFLGGVDPAKGIDFLLEAAHLTAEHLPGFVLLVGGAGQSLQKVRAAEADGAPLRVLGRLDGQRKALALRAADVMAIPEWIGLVAVDSLVAGRPIVSTLHPSHSPEHEYLVNGETAIFSAHTPAAFGRALAQTLTSDDLPAMQARCLVEAPKYDIDEMAARFVEGILLWRDYSWKSRNR